MAKFSNEIEDYFKRIDKEIKKAYDVATKARKKGFDPEDKVDIPLAKNMAERVEGLISAVAPQIIGSGVSERIKELEEKYGSLDWRISLIIAEEIANEKFCKFKDKKEAMEIGIRVGFAYHTMGTVSAPLEGFVELKFRKRKDGKEYVAVFYSGPIRAAGGTGASVSALITDYLRKKMGYEVYDPTDKEIKRMVAELYDYHERITNLQYLPSHEEIEFLVKHLPLQIDGDPSEKIEVSNHKDLDRIETNCLRNGVCLVIGEGIAQKAPKLWKQLSKWGKDFGLGHWDFLEEFISLQKKIKAKSKGDETEEKLKISPDYTFIKDMVAGRAVLTHPMREGGFRLRYGRSRNSGYSSYCIHPATMHLLNDYIAIGTQLKIERPGKATALSVCDTLEGPIVKLKDGSVKLISSEIEAKKISKDVETILFLGDILMNYGDFFNRSHLLVPPGYCEEWYIRELEKAVKDLFGSIDLAKLSNFTKVDVDVLKQLLKNITYKPSASDSLKISLKLNIPLHPLYSYHWKLINNEEFKVFLQWLNKSNLIIEENEIQKLILPFDEKPKDIIERIGLFHLYVNKEHIVFEKDHAIILNKIFSLDNYDSEHIIKTLNDSKDPLETINKLTQFEIRDKSGVFIGSRMGRPEKAKQRKLTGSPHALFPIGDEGERLRSFQSALENGKVTAEFSIYRCLKCDKETIFTLCETCGKKTKKVYLCNECGILEKECEKHRSFGYKEMSVDIRTIFSKALLKLNMKTYPDLIKGVRGTSNKNHIIEDVAKGILRAKHDIYVNKDGTTRYDMSQLALTHFIPIEIGTSVEKLKEIGYKKDIYGNELVNDTQLLELKPQDLILPACDQSPEEPADAVLFRVSKFIDDLLENFYGINSYYNLKSEKDLVGHLVLGLAPHTSAPIVGRIVGFSKTQAFYANPMFHAATRRDCDGDEACVILLMDALLNFSRQFLPAHRGSTQDTCLVLTSRLIPSEVDDMVFDMDLMWKYPLEFYQACMEYKEPWSIKLDQLKSRLGTEKQYEDFGFTHNISNINLGVRCSAYKTIPSMELKLKGQMDVAAKIRAVDTSDVARLVIDKHFLKDIKGNLRKFSMQKFRCVKCSEKFRRPPLIGRCTKCDGKIIFTISQGSVLKYLEPSISLAENYQVSDYLQQTLVLLKRMTESVFGKDKEKQSGLGSWFG